MAPAVRSLLHAAALVAGAAAGILGSFVQPLRLGPVPLGLLLGIALSAAVFVTFGVGVGARSGAAVAAAGWALAVLALAAPRPEGDLVVAASTAGYVWLLGGMLLAGGAITLPYAGLAAPPAEARPARLPVSSGPSAPAPPTAPPAERR